MEKSLKIWLILIFLWVIWAFLYILRDIILWYRYQSLLVILTIILVLIVVKIKKSKRQKFLKYISIVLSVLIFLLVLILLWWLSNFWIMVYDWDVCIEYEENNYDCYSLSPYFHYGLGIHIHTEWFEI